MDIDVTSSLVRNVYFLIITICHFVIASNMKWNWYVSTKGAGSGVRRKIKDIDVGRSHPC